MTDQSKAGQTKHTPGPWKAGPVFNSEGRALFWNDTSKPGKWQRRLDSGGVFTHEDAARIVACVNACEGLVDPVTDVRFLREGNTHHARALADRDTLAAQNAELVALVREIGEWFVGHAREVPLSSIPLVARISSALGRLGGGS